MSVSIFTPSSPSTGELVRFDDLPVCVHGVRFLSSGDLVALGGFTTVEFRSVWSGTKMHELTVPDGFGPPQALAMSPTGNRVLWASSRSGLHLLDANGRDLTRATGGCRGVSVFRVPGAGLLPGHPLPGRDVRGPVRAMSRLSGDLRRRPLAVRRVVRGGAWPGVRPGVGPGDRAAACPPGQGRGRGTAHAYLPRGLVVGWPLGDDPR